LSSQNNRKPWYRRRWIIATGVMIALIAWLQLQVPSNAGPWHEAQGRTPRVEFAGRRFTVYDVRDMRYDANQRIVSPNYIDQDFNLDNLQRTWFGLSHFGPMDLAHSFLSYGAESSMVYLPISVNWGKFSLSPIVLIFITSNHSSRSEAMPKTPDRRSHYAWGQLWRVAGLRRMAGRSA